MSIIEKLTRLLLLRLAAVRVTSALRARLEVPATWNMAFRIHARRGALFDLGSLSKDRTSIEMVFSVTGKIEHTFNRERVGCIDLAKKRLYLPLQALVSA